jgi:Transmembrane family 220, helix
VEPCLSIKRIPIKQRSAYIANCGVKTSTTMPGGTSFVTNAYCFGAATFFAACAYAQSNDPDPELWVASYLFAGCGLNLAVVTMTTRPSQPYTVSASLVMLRRTTQACAMVNGGCLLWWTATLLPKLDIAQDPKAFAWSFLEFEEGREIGGLLILFLHILKLLDFEFSGQYPASTKNAVSNWGTLVVIGLISGAIYMWVEYQPQMNMRENMGHCAGVFQNTIFSSSASLMSNPTSTSTVLEEL